LAGVRAAVNADAKVAKSARAIVAAGQHAFLPVVQLLVRAGADLNAIYRGYRALHSLVQERPHGETKASRDRLECMDWMLANGADPELPAAWPPARAILVAAFMGDPQFVKRLKTRRPDGFVYAALGDVKGVKKILGTRPSFANERDA